METRLQVRFNAYNLALSYLKENESLTKEVPAFAASYEMARAKLDAITENENRRQQKTGPATVQKETLKADLANLSLIVAGLIGSYASLQNDPTLLATVKFSNVDLLYAPAQALISRSSNILALAKKLAGPLKEHGLTEAMISNLAALNEKYTANAQAPRSEKAERKIAGTEIKVLLREVDTIFTKQLDALMRIFSSTHRSFYNGYLIKREIQDRGHRKTRLEGLVVEDGTAAPLSGVDISIDETDLAIQTGSDGTYDLQLPVLIDAVVRFKKAGYKTVEKTFSLRLGLVTRLEVEMQKE